MSDLKPENCDEYWILKEHTVTDWLTLRNTKRKLKPLDCVLYWAGKLTEVYDHEDGYLVSHAVEELELALSNYLQDRKELT